MNHALSVLRICGTALLLGTTASWSSSDLHLTQHDVLETHGLSVLLFHNPYHRVFGDQKMNGMEIILHDQRIATSGDLRLSATPEQWDPIPDFKERKRGPAPDEVAASCAYPDHGLSYRIDVQPEPEGFRVAVQLDQAVPAALVGKAGFNLEFLPTLYFGKSYLVDDGAGMLPRHADGPMERAADGTVEPLPLATGHRIVLSPEDPTTRVTVTSDSGPILLFDGRNKAQNGWFVVRTLIPAARATPLMDQEFKEGVASALAAYKPKVQELLAQNPYAVPISTGGWGGSAGVTRFATEMYFLHQAFPEIIGPSYTLDGLDYVLGRHPASNVSYVSGVGTQSKLIAYGNNRADYTFVPGGVIPGVVIIQPDFPELKEGWPFLWYENEYVVDAVTSYILAANAAHAETKHQTAR